MKNKTPIHMPFIDVLICLIPSAMILASSKTVPLSNNITYLLYILIIFLDVIRNKKLIFIKETSWLMIAVIMSMFVIPLIIGHINTMSSLAYVLLMIVYVYVINIVARRLSLDKDKKILKGWAFLGFITILPFIISNTNEINASTIRNILSSSTSRTRAYFGMIHPNTAAIILVSLIMSIYTILKKKLLSSTFLKSVSLIVLLILFILLICTGSRTGIYSISIFFIMEIALSLIGRVKSPKKKTMIYFLLAILISICASRVSFESIVADTSNRDIRVSSSLQKLKEQNILIFGAGASSISEMKENFSMYGIKGEDNWYYTEIARFGIVGLIILLCSIFATMITAWRASRASCDFTLCFSLMILTLIYGLAENSVLIQSLPISIIAWSLIYLAIYEYNQNKEKYA